MMLPKLLRSTRASATLGRSENEKPHQSTAHGLNPRRRSCSVLPPSASPRSPSRPWPYRVGCDGVVADPRAMLHTKGTSTVGWSGSTVGSPSLEPIVENRDSGTDSGWVSRSPGLTGLAPVAWSTTLRTDAGQLVDGVVHRAADIADRRRQVGRDLGLGREVVGHADRALDPPHRGAGREVLHLAHPEGRRAAGDRAIGEVGVSQRCERLVPEVQRPLGEVAGARDGEVPGEEQVRAVDPGPLELAEELLQVGPAGLGVVGRIGGRRRAVPVGPEERGRRDEAPVGGAEVAEDDDVAVALDELAGRSQLEQPVGIGRPGVLVELGPERLAATGGGVEEDDRRVRPLGAGQVGDARHRGAPRPGQVERRERRSGSGCSARSRRCGPTRSGRSACRPRRAASTGGRGPRAARCRSRGRPP